MASGATQEEGAPLRDVLTMNNEGFYHSGSQEEEESMSMGHLRYRCVNDPAYNAYVLERMKAPPLLLFGTLGVSLASACVFAVAWVLYCQVENVEYDFRYRSGRGYLPSTFAELTWRHSGVQGRVFGACGIMSAMSIQTSWYTSLLRNVFTGSQQLIFWPHWRWSTIRQMCPTMGLMLVVGVSSCPRAVWDRSPGWSLLAGVLIHSVGCWTVFLSYALSELQCCTGWFTVRNESEFREDQRIMQSEAHLSTFELRVRLILNIVSWICCLVFVCSQVWLVSLKWDCPRPDGNHTLDKVKSDHCDEWGFPGEIISIDVHGFGTLLARSKAAAYVGRNVIVEDVPTVVNTASGMIWWLKVTSLCSEFLGILSFCASALLVWYFCEERHFNREWLSDTRHTLPKRVQAYDIAIQAIKSVNRTNGRPSHLQNELTEASKDECVHKTLQEHGWASDSFEGIPDWMALSQRLEDERARHADDEALYVDMHGSQPLDGSVDDGHRRDLVRRASRYKGTIQYYKRTVQQPPPMERD